MGARDRFAARHRAGQRRLASPERAGSGGKQALETSLGFLIVAIHVYEDLRGASIVSDMNSGDPYQANARVSQLAFHQRFNLLAQGFPQPSAMILNAALLHSSPRSKTHENIRKSGTGVGLEVLLSRTKEWRR